MTIDEAMKVLEMQEEILQFSHFTNGDAWELGTLLIAEAKLHGLNLAVRITLNNGYVVFQHGMDGTSLFSEKRLIAKTNTVRLMEKSSLFMSMLLKKSGETLDDLGLNSKDVSFDGGAFPIRVEEVGVIGAVAVSGIGHVPDHDLIIKCISKYLHVDEVPRIVEQGYGMN